MGSGEIINRADTEKKVVALTFDDVPTPDVLPEVLDLLMSEEIKATFFMIGRMMLQNPTLVRRTLQEEHEIGNHSMSHISTKDLSDQQVIDETVGVQTILKERFSYDCTLYRAPYLAYDDRLKETLKDLKLTPIGRSIRALDYRKDVESGKVTENVVREIHPGGIILMHELKKSFTSLPAIIHFYKQEGYTFTTISKLLKENN